MRHKYLILFLIIFCFYLIYLIYPVPYCQDSNQGQWVKIIGTSMLPEIKNNSYCFCVQKENYQVGDIIEYFTVIDNELVEVVHRIISIRNDEIITKGDLNNFTDSPIIKEDIICYVPYISRIKLYIGDYSL